MVRETNMNEKRVWADSYEGFIEIAKAAGLQYLGYRNKWLVIWKPGTTDGWITRAGSDDRTCYCEDCISWETKRILRAMIRNIGLETVAIGERLDIYTRGVAYDLGLVEVDSHESTVYQAFNALYVPRAKRDEEYIKIRRLLPNAREELSRRRAEIEKLTREVSLLEEELNKLTQAA